MAEKYDVVIAICADRLKSTQDYCDRLDESTADSVVANVLFGKAGGHEVAVQVQVVEGGDVTEDSVPERVPVDRSWLHGVTIPRSLACADPNCALVVRAYVDGLEVDAQEFQFVGR